MAALTLARAYQSSFDARPNATLAVTGGCLNALGDIVAQTSHNILRKEHDERAPFDPTRTLRFFVFGATISPFLGRWNTFLEKQFPLRALSGTGKVSRVAADQIVMYAAMGVLEDRSRKADSSGTLPPYFDLFMPTLATNWTVWPFVQFVNFRFMPLPYRVPFQSACGVFWTLYLSTVNAREDRKQDRDTAMLRTLG
ncbi:hypothetical protein DFH06DRAFT_1201429 [Mycena polygramma]|nr:hypothetical protein DFH06DRAFT_1201429 [Mycena polygramma]